MMKTAQTFEDLVVWQKAHAFVLCVYSLFASYSKTEIYGLTSQLRRAAVSIAANIAEGFRKRGNADKARFFNIAQGSLEECRYYLILTHDLEHGDVTESRDLLHETSKLLHSYSSKILNSVS